MCIRDRLGPKCKFSESKFCYWCQNIWEVNGRGGDGWILVAVQLGGVGKSGWLLPSTGSCCESSFHSSHGGRISHVMAEALLTSNKSTLGRLPPGASTPSGGSAPDGGYREWCPARRHTPSTWARRPRYARMGVLLGGVGLGVEFLILIQKTKGVDARTTL